MFLKARNSYEWLWGLISYKNYLLSIWLTEWLNNDSKLKPLFSNIIVKFNPDLQCISEWNMLRSILDLKHNSS